MRNKRCQFVVFFLQGLAGGCTPVYFCGIQTTSVTVKKGVFRSVTFLSGQMSTYYVFVILYIHCPEDSTFAGLVAGL